MKRMNNNNKHLESQKNKVIMFTGGGATPLFYAFKKVLEVFYDDSVSVCESDKELTAKPDHTHRVGLMVFFLKEEDFFTYFEDLYKAGCRYFVAARPFGNRAIPWEKMPAHVSASFLRHCEVVPLLLPDILNALEVQFQKAENDISQHDNHPGFAIEACRARRLYTNYIKQFTHAAPDDISNALLAPAGALCKNDGNPLTINYGDSKNVITIKGIKEKFKDSAVDKIKPDDGDLGTAIQKAWEDIGEIACDDKNVTFKKSPVRENFHRLMGLLTEVRILAGEKPGAEQKKKGNDASSDAIIRQHAESANKNFRVLVLDDHAVYWKPVFDEVRKTIDSRNMDSSVDIEYSADSQNILTGGSLWTKLADYDLVLLDIYLKDSASTGLKILEDIRSRLMWLPVIVWTTATEAELPAKANLANGFLFKKKTSVKEIADVFIKWIEQGQSRRKMALPNPFFDHVLKSEKIRECAFAFTHWALKQVDSFHALDERFLRFFNDHGGRHTIQLLNIIEKMLRPFLFSNLGKDHIPAVLSTDSEEREQEVLWLYIAVLCHELGMFPMKTDGSEGEEQFQCMTEAELYYVRKQHCLRSLLLMFDEKKQSPDFQDLVENLEKTSKKEEVAYETSEKKGVTKGVAAVAALAGYHGRYLSLKQGEFFTVEKEAHEELNKARKDSPRYAVIEEELVQKLTSMNDNFKDSNNRERLRRLCALMRFGDALDVDYTRVPADFLLFCEGVSASQLRENAKRQVVENVVIDRGEISLLLNAPKPKFRELTQGINKKSISISGDQAEFINFVLLENKWPDSHKEKTVKAIKKFQEHIEKYVDGQFFSVPNRHEVFNGPEKGIALQLVALAVIFEIYNEYQAINHTGLAQIIKLGFIRWEGCRPQRIPVIYNWPQVHFIEMSPGSNFFEFKYLLPVNSFSQNIFGLICARGKIGSLKVSRQHFEQIRDEYFDVTDRGGLQEENEGKDTVVRRRWIQGMEVTQKKTCKQVYGQYNQYKTETIEKSRSKVITVIENDRRTLQLQVKAGSGIDETAFLHLDLFNVSIPKANKEVVPLQLQEIEIISTNERLIMDVEEEIVSAFNLIKVHKSKFAKFQDAIDRYTREASPIKIWLDMDTGVDDAMALLMALRSAKYFDIAGVSVVGGNVNIDQCAVNTAKILFYHEKKTLEIIPIYKGVGPRLKTDASDVHGKDGIGDINSFVPGFDQIKPDFKDLFTEFAHIKADDVTFISTGPLTNLARLIQDYPEKIKVLRQIVIMGGVFWEAGNRSAAAEFNIFSDPESARTVLDFCRKNRIRHVFVPLDVSHRAVLKRADLAENAFLSALSETYMNFYDLNQALDGCPLHDPMAVGYVLWPELFVTDSFHVEISGTGAKPMDGVTVADCRPTRIFQERNKQVTDIVVRVDKNEFKKRLLELLR